MKIMPRYKLRIMRSLAERMLTWISTWEDRHGNEHDYRMAHLNSGLWQASQSLREILDNEFNPMRKHEGVKTVGKPWVTEKQMGEHYATEMFSRAPIPLSPVD